MYRRGTLSIKERAMRLIEKYGTDDPFYLADILGITVVYDDLGGISGHYVKYLRRKYIIIDENAPEEMLVFICAHELGHAIITEDDNTKRLTAFSGRNALKNMVERRANEFAVNLLLNNGYLRENEGCGIYDLARRRGVPSRFVFLLDNRLM